MLVKIKNNSKKSKLSESELQLIELKEIKNHLINMRKNISMIKVILMAFIIFFLLSLLVIFTGSY